MDECVHRTAVREGGAEAEKREEAGAERRMEERRAGGEMPGGTAMPAARPLGHARQADGGSGAAGGKKRKKRKKIARPADILREVRPRLPGSALPALPAGSATRRRSGGGAGASGTGGGRRVGRALGGLLGGGRGPGSGRRRRPSLPLPPPCRPRAPVRLPRVLMLLRERRCRRRALPRAAPAYTRLARRRAPPRSMARRRARVAPCRAATAGVRARLTRDLNMHTLRGRPALRPAGRRRPPRRSRPRTPLSAGCRVS